MHSIPTHITCLFFNERLSLSSTHIVRVVPSDCFMHADLKNLDLSFGFSSYSTHSLIIFSLLFPSRPPRVLHHHHKMHLAAHHPRFYPRCDNFLPKVRRNCLDVIIKNGKGLRMKASIHTLEPLELILIIKHIQLLTSCL